jgi:hypothetical protein
MEGIANRMKLLTRSTATAVVALGLSVGVGTAAFAVQEPPPVPRSGTESAPLPNKRRCVKAINRRVIDLAKWSARLSLRPNLSQAQKDELMGQLKAVSDQLLTTALPAVQNATTRAQLRAACKTITENYRVYLVVHPRTFITANAYAWQKRIAELQTKADMLEAAGKNTAAAEALLAHAKGLADAIPGTVQPIQPATWNANPAGTKIIFTTAKGQLTTIKADVQAAARMLRRLART